METAKQQPRQRPNTDNKPDRRQNKDFDNKKQNSYNRMNQNDGPKPERPAFQKRPRDDLEIVHVSQEQMDLIVEFQKQARKITKILKDDEVAALCVENEFNAAKIQAALAKYETDPKYAGIQDYEWNRTQTGEQKNRARRQTLFREIIKDKLAAKMQKDQVRIEKEKAAEEEAKAIEDEAKKNIDDEKRRLKREKFAAKRAAKKEQRMQEKKENGDDQEQDETANLLDQVESEVKADAEVDGKLTEEQKEILKAAKKAKKEEQRKLKKAAKRAEKIENKKSEAELPVTSSSNASPVEEVKETKKQYRPKVIQQEAVKEPVAAVVTEAKAEKKEKPEISAEEKQAKKDAKKEAKKAERKEDKDAKKAEKKDKKKVHFDAQAETATPVAQNAAPQMATPQMPQMMPVMGGMPTMMPQMPMAGLTQEQLAGMTLEQQNVYNQQVILMQQQAFQQYHQQMMHMMLAQQQQLSTLQGQPPK